MSFWAFIAILAILGVMLGSLYLSKLATDREIQEIEKKKKIRTLRNDLIDIDEILNTLLVYDRDTNLLFTLSKRMQSLIQQGLNLLPSDENLATDLSDLEKINQQIQALSNEPIEPEIPVSDRQIFLMKKHFSRTIRLIKELHTEGLIDELHASNHRARLIRNSLLLEVKAYRSQGDDAREKGETSSAANFYKHAKELLVNSDVKFPEKMDHIKQISRKISGLYITIKQPDSDDKPKKKSD
jgi:hypothetical protein